MPKRRSQQQQTLKQRKQRHTHVCKPTRIPYKCKLNLQSSLLVSPTIWYLCFSVLPKDFPALFSLFSLLFSFFFLWLLFASSISLFALFFSLPLFFDPLLINRGDCFSSHLILTVSSWFLRPRAARVFGLSAF